MSFMFKPLAYDDPRAVNRIALAQGTVSQIIRGNEAVEERIAAFCGTGGQKIRNGTGWLCQCPICRDSTVRGSEIEESRISLPSD